jgi:hypothetical protein
MKIFKFFFLIAILQISYACNSAKNTLGNDSSIDDAIMSSITDFVKSRQFKNGKRFSLQVLGLTNSELLAIRIGKDDSKILMLPNAVVGSKGLMPSRYVEKDGRLIYWSDENYVLSEEALSVFVKYDLIEKRDSVGIPEFSTDDAQKNAHYYFCKEHPTKYKKVVTSRGIGYYKPPELNCK